MSVSKELGRRLEEKVFIDEEENSYLVFDSGRRKVVKWDLKGGFTGLLSTNGVLTEEDARNKERLDEYLEGLPDEIAAIVVSFFDGEHHEQSLAAGSEAVG